LPRLCHPLSPSPLYIAFSGQHDTLDLLILPFFFLSFPISGLIAIHEYLLLLYASVPELTTQTHSRVFIVPLLVVLSCPFCMLLLSITEAAVIARIDWCSPGSPSPPLANVALLAVLPCIVGHILLTPQRLEYSPWFFARAMQPPTAFFWVFFGVVSFPHFYWFSCAVSLGCLPCEILLIHFYTPF